jgi:hypothetical protein
MSQFYWIYILRSLRINDVFRFPLIFGCRIITHLQLKIRDFVVHGGCFLFILYWIFAVCGDNRDHCTLFQLFSLTTLLLTFKKSQTITNADDLYITMVSFNFSQMKNKIKKRFVFILTSLLYFWVQSRTKCGNTKLHGYKKTDTDIFPD